jgi:hypothetical protein
MSPGQDLPGPPPQPPPRPGGLAGFLAHRLADRVDHAGIGPAVRRSRPGGPAALTLPRSHLPAQPLECAEPGLVASRRQLRDLGDLPLPHRTGGRVVLGLRDSTRAGLWPQPGDDLENVPLPPARLPGNGGRQLAQQPIRRQPGRPPRRDQLESRVREQLSQRHHRLGPGDVRQPDPRCPHRDHSARPVPEPDLITGPQHPRPGHRHDVPPATAITDEAPSREPARSAARTPDHNR